MAIGDPYEEHPLLSEPDRLEEILTKAYNKILSVLFDGSGPARGKGHSEPSIRGGVSAEDVLQEVFEALLAHATTKQEDLSRSWIPLAIGIASNKAYDAWRASFKGLGGTRHRHPITVVSLDSTTPLAEGLAPARVLDTFPDFRFDPEEEALAICRVEQLWELAKELLNDRQLRIYVEIKHKERTRKEVGEELGLKGQRIGQIYEEILRTLERHSKYPY